MRKLSAIYDRAAPWPSSRYLVLQGIRVENNKGMQVNQGLVWPHAKSE
jgi:hypothetical protein